MIHFIFLYFYFFFFTINYIKKIIKIVLNEVELFSIFFIYVHIVILNFQLQILFLYSKG